MKLCHFRKLFICLVCLLLIAIACFISGALGLSCEEEVVVAKGLQAHEQVIFKYYLGLRIVRNRIPGRSTIAKINRPIIFTNNTLEDMSWVGQTANSGPGSTDMNNIPLDGMHPRKVYYIAYGKAPIEIGAPFPDNYFTFPAGASKDEIGAFFAARIFARNLEGVELK